MTVLKTNIIANYVGQAFVVITGFIMLPVYIRYMGAEAYGLIGFATTLQVCAQLLDFGLTPTLSRELSRFRGGTFSQKESSNFARVLEWVFASLGGVTVLSFFLFSKWIATYWLREEHLHTWEVEQCLTLMGCTLATRWLVGLYRGALVGLEELVNLNVLSVLISSVRSIGTVVVFLTWTIQPHGFFTYQFIVSAVELTAICALFYAKFPMSEATIIPSFRPIIKFGFMVGGMGFLSCLWLIISQADKIILSRTLTLHAFGQFSIAVSIAGGITLLAAPICQAVQTRFVVLASSGEREELIRLYRLSTQLTVAGLSAVAGVLVVYARPIVWAWTGNEELAKASALILSLYAGGNAVAALLALTFQVQFAFGKTRWHVIGNTVFASVWIPALYISTKSWGAIGAGVVWFTGNLMFLLFWVPYVHGKLFEAFRWKWLIQDVAKVSMVVGAVLVLFRLSPLPAGRFGIIFALGLFALVSGAIGVLCSRESRATFVGTLMAIWSRIYL